MANLRYQLSWQYLITLLYSTSLKDLAPVVRALDNEIPPCINLYPVDGWKSLCVNDGV